MAEKLRELAERCEAAKGPDRELDVEIFRAIGAPVPFHFLGKMVAIAYDEAERYYFSPVGDMRVRYEPAAYTASIDAAMSLAKPAWWLSMGGPLSPEAYGYSREEERIFRCGFSMIEEPYSSGGCGATLPLSICAAALRTLSTGKE